MKTHKLKNVTKSGGYLNRFVRWPRGKYNGKYIVGIEACIKFHITWWRFNINWRIDTKAIHIGPIHIWVYTVYSAT